MRGAKGFGTNTWKSGMKPIIIEFSTAWTTVQWQHLAGNNFDDVNYDAHLRFALQACRPVWRSGSVGGGAFVRPELGRAGMSVTAGGVGLDAWRKVFGIRTQGFHPAARL